MKSKYYLLKSKVGVLRKSGKTYGEIRKILKENIAKSTLSYWCRNIFLTEKQKKRIARIVLRNIKIGREKALSINKARREQYLKTVINRNIHLKNLLKNKDIAKITLATLYLGEGSKDIKRGYLYFGNSDPFIIDLFLNLIRGCYNINESKFRCTLQCRADQHIKKLENFWSKTTKIPLSQFYKTRIDPRTIGKKSEKPNYKGVCRIDYFSADILNELLSIPKIIHKMGP